MTRKWSERKLIHIPYITTVRRCCVVFTLWKGDGKRSTKLGSVEDEQNHSPVMIPWQGVQQTIDGAHNLVVCLHMRWAGNKGVWPESGWRPGVWVWTSLGTSKNQTLCWTSFLFQTENLEKHQKERQYSHSCLFVVVPSKRRCPIKVPPKMHHQGQSLSSFWLLILASP